MHRIHKKERKKERYSQSRKLLNYNLGVDATSNWINADWRDMN